MNRHVTATLPQAKERQATPHAGQPRRRLYVGLLLVGFALATASFVGSTLYADLRLEHVAQRTHDVSDNAMPSLAALAAARYELAQVHLAIDESVEGEVEQMRDVEPHWKALEDALAEYAAQPQFPGEPELWSRGRVQADELHRTVSAILERVGAGELRTAGAMVAREFDPAMRDLDRTLADLVQLNHAQGRIAADEADAAWTQTRRLSILLDVLCAVATAGLTVAAYLGFRRHSAVTARRAEELEAFAARVAHDIRGPLTPAMFALQSVARHPGPEGEGRQRNAERGVRSLRRVEELVNDLLAFARSGTAPDADADASAPLRGIVGGILQDLEPDASAARVELCSEELPACDVACTPGVLTSIVLNLVSNAIKHFPDDREPRRIVLRGAVRGPCIRVEVADTGAGLEPAQQARIFEPYVSLDERHRGLGLGLATVRRLVEAHGGVVGVRSRLGDGATFWFDLPLRRGGAT